MSSSSTIIVIGTTLRNIENLPAVEALDVSTEAGAVGDDFGGDDLRGTAQVPKLQPRIVYDPDSSGEAYKPRREKKSKAKVNMRESEEAYIKLGSDVVLLVGEGDKGGAGGGMRPRIGEGVVRRQPRVLVERKILPLRTSQSQISPETKPSHPPKAPNYGSKTETDECGPWISDRTAGFSRKRQGRRRSRRSVVRRRSPGWPSTPPPAATE
ncbi:hypothetical protein GW17_00021567 [Ensete ventricosum]|nr:hypothetical protein GW17_00021567 [Ensete ventricosum]